MGYPAMSSPPAPNHCSNTSNSPISGILRWKSSGSATSTEAPGCVNRFMYWSEARENDGGSAGRDLSPVDCAGLNGHS